MIAGLGELARGRRVVTLAPDLVDIGKADIVHGHRELLVDAGPADAALGQSGGEARIGSEAAVAGAAAAADDSFAVERSGVAGDPEADRAAVTVELGRAQPLQSAGVHRMADPSSGCCPSGG